MKKPAGITASLGLIALVCFFLPWVQVSCGAERDTAAGLDLARDGTAGLWLIPILLVVVIAFAFRLMPGSETVFRLITLVAGLVTAYLMNRERLRFGEHSGLIETRMTGWFWLGLIASIGLAVVGAAEMLRRPKPT